MIGGIEPSLNENGIEPVARDTRNNCNLYSTEIIPNIIDIYGPIYLDYLKKRYELINDLLVHRARQTEKQNNIM